MGMVQWLYCRAECRQIGNYMIKINQIKLPVTHSQEALKNEIQKKLKIKTDFSYQILKKSIDARKKPDIYYIYSVSVDLGQPAREEKLIKKIKDNNILLYRPKTYTMEEAGQEVLRERPVIVGAGPAGLFCAYILTEAGYSPLVIERGSCIEKRTEDVKKFWETGILDTSSNVQFGEGGAGTFSDGKLNTSVKDPKNRNSLVLSTFAKFGADSDILYDNKPHIGTDVLSKVIVNMRKYLVDKGCSFMFDTLVDDFILENGRIIGVHTDKGDYDTRVCVLALGHSSRDTFARLLDKKLDMECKQFAVGFRVEHPQEMINLEMYGKQDRIVLPAAPFKVTSNFPNGRGVYSFCMCPGGYVVNSASDRNQTVVNGMSYSGRNGHNANSAIIVSVGPADFKGQDALAGVRYQQEIEKYCYDLGRGRIPQQLFGDYCDRRETSSYGDYESTTKGGHCFADLRGLFSNDIEESFIAGMKHFGHIITGFDRKDAILSGVESRTSSPVRIKRDQVFESNVKGIYPCGEGAGYAGGIVSAAMDGIKTAEAIIRKFRPQ